jgi:spermidine synthase
LGVFGSVFLSLALVLATLFATALVCHGELARRRPQTRHLTEFYVWMSLGGILGSAFCALLAPLLFDRVLEFTVLLVLAALLRGFSLPAMSAETPKPRLVLATTRAAAAPLALGAVAVLPGLSGASSEITFNTLLIVTAAVLGVALISGRHSVRLGLCLAVLAALDAGFTNAGSTMTRLHSERTYFATHQILSLDRGRYVALVHGTTIHGVQAVDPARRREVLGYFHADAGIGRVFRALESAQLRDVAVLGMGAGTLACYRTPDQRWTFFEIDPAVIRIAKDSRWFHFIAECAPDARLAVGDGRLLLSAEKAGRYDVLVADAFSSDSIPVHLYTREAVNLYFEKLAPSGVLLMNVSNRYIDIEPALAALAREAGLSARIFRSHPPDGVVTGSMRFASIWIAMARSEAVLAPLTDAFDAAQPSAWGRWRPLAERKGVRAWTDDYSNLIDVMR